MRTSIASIYPARLLTPPVIARAETRDGRTLVTVEGLVCGWCAARSARAFAALPAVRSAHVDLASGVATIEHEPGAPPSTRALAAALETVVVARRLRRLLGALRAPLWRREARAQ